MNERKIQDRISMVWFGLLLKWHFSVSFPPHVKEMWMPQTFVDGKRWCRQSRIFKYEHNHGNSPYKTVQNVHHNCNFYSFEEKKYQRYSEQLKIEIDWKRERQKKNDNAEQYHVDGLVLYILLFIFSFIDAMRCCFLDFLLLLLFLSSCFNLLDVVVQFENKLRSSYRYLYICIAVFAVLFLPNLLLW